MCVVGGVVGLGGDVFLVCVGVEILLFVDVLFVLGIGGDVYG